MEELLNALHFHDALIISITLFFVDWMAGIAAALRSGRRIKSSIMRSSIAEKSEKWFTYLLVGLAFNYTETFDSVAAMVVLIPFVPEVVSIFENVRIARTRIDTKPKREDDSDGR